ncbi:MAG: hypothetical protein KBC12_00965 [Candidatus Pacebacteria bacterium]|nr:hypothetical protein [Candidatus Paceibacterota bacterium]MBP9851502.1 hypothetical protein [Candidatus Paceibacterota bacterium]
MTKTYTQKKGFTLVETMLYVVVAGTLVLFMSLFTGMIVDARIKNRTIAEVEEQGAHVLRVVTQSVRNSNSVNAPAAGVVGATLSLGNIDPLLNPTIFDLNGSTLRIKEGVGAPIELTNSHVAVSSLNFENLSELNTPGVVRVSFVLTHLNPESRNEYDFSKTWSTSISLRDN